MMKSCIVSHRTCSKYEWQDLGFLTVDTHRRPWGSVVNHYDSHCDIHVRGSIGTASPDVTQRFNLKIDTVK